MIDFIIDEKVVSDLMMVINELHHPRAVYLSGIGTFIQVNSKDAT